MVYSFFALFLFLFFASDPSTFPILLIAKKPCSNTIPKKHKLYFLTCKLKYYKIKYKIALLFNTYYVKIQYYWKIRLSFKPIYILY